MFLTLRSPIVLLYSKISLFLLPLLPGRWVSSGGDLICREFFHLNNKTCFMKVLYVILTCTTLFSIQAQAQNKWFTRTGKVSFFSTTSAENIDATNNEAFSLVDITKGEVAFQVLV